MELNVNFLSTVYSLLTSPQHLLYTRTQSVTQQTVQRMCKYCVAVNSTKQHQEENFMNGFCGHFIFLQVTISRTGQEHIKMVLGIRGFGATAPLFLSPTRSALESHQEVDPVLTSVSQTTDITISLAQHGPEFSVR